MAVKIVRQANQIALIGAATSAGAHAPGTERAPAALRAAGLVERLRAIGYEVIDLGDIEPQRFQPDEEAPRARNLAAVLAALNELRPKVEQAVRSGALPLILGGDCTIALATAAGLRRYFRQLALIYFDRDADLHVPATTPSGRLHGMAVAHLIGKGAAELVRFWGEPPLVREPEIALFGLDRLDPPELEFLEHSPMLRYFSAEISSQGAAAVAEAVCQRLQAGGREVLLHFDVDVVDADEFGACDVPARGGLRWNEARQALEVFVRQKQLAAIEVTEFNPEKDPDGSKAAALAELLAEVLAARRATLQEVPAAAAEAAEVARAETPNPPATPAEPGEQRIGAERASTAESISSESAPERWAEERAADTGEPGESA
ncbi:MAG: arginase family protein [Acidobacteriia bacterium]|nr:arginase family protein [Terriglobia bacterium]